ncbi:MAG: VOC family protein [Phycisphaerales bacterium]|nr:VOC family protein [Phycisphaerales bacterium]
MPAKATKGNITTGHVGLNVTNLEKSKDFYGAAFGLEVMTEVDADDRRFAFLTDGRRLVLSLWEQSVGRFDAALPGLHHLAFEVESVEKVRETEARIRKLGAPLLYDGIVAHSDGAASGGIFFEDPDGTRLEVYSLDAGKGHRAPSGGAPSCGMTDILKCT